MAMKKTKSSTITESSPKEEVDVDDFARLDLKADLVEKEMIIRVRVADGKVRVRLTTNKFPTVDIPIAQSQIETLLAKEYAGLI